MSQRNRTRRALCAAGAIGVLMFAISLPARSSETLAAWSDPEYASAGVTAILLPTPTVTSCVANDVVVLGKNVTVKWTIPATPVLAVPSNIQFYFSKNGALPNLLPIGTGVSTTGPVGGVYTSVFDVGLLGLLTTQGMIGIATSSGGWTSAIVTYHAEWHALSADTCVPSP